MIISIDAENVPDKIQYPFLINALKKRGTERNFLNLIKSLYKNIQPTYLRVTD